MYVPGLSVNQVISSTLYLKLALLRNSDIVVVPANIFLSWFRDLKAPRKWKAVATKYTLSFRQVLVLDLWLNLTKLNLTT